MTTRREAFPDDKRVIPTIRTGSDNDMNTEQVVGIAADVLRGYGHDAIADALIAASQITEAQVRAGAEVLLRDYRLQYDGGTIDEFTDLSREVLATARAS